MGITEVDAAASDSATVDAATVDAASGDAAIGDDAATRDAGTDAATHDAGTDAATYDAGTDAATDAGRDAGPPLPFSSVSVGDSNAFTLPPSTFVVVPYSAELHDDLSELDASTGRFTATHTGIYRICASLYDGGAPQPIELAVFVDGVRERSLGRGVTVARGCRAVALAAGSVADVRAYHAGSAALSVSPNLYWNWLTIDEEPRTGSAISVIASTAFTGASSAFTQVPYTTEAYDTTGEWDPASSHFTASHAGDFEICASLASTDLVVAFELDLFVGGVRERAIAAGAGIATGCRTVRLAAGAVVDVRAWQSSGAATGFMSNPYWSWVTIDELSGTTAVSMGNASSVSVPNATFTTVPYGTPLYDDGAEYVLAMSRFTATRAGDYEICGSMLAPTSIAFELDLFVDGARERALTYAPLSVGTGCRTVRLGAGQQVRIGAYQGSGSSTTVAPNALWDWLTVHSVR